MADIRISRLYLINNMSKSGMQYIIFHIFWVKDLNLTLRNVIDALCKEIIIHHQTVTIATDKHDYILRIHTSILHHMTPIRITFAPLYPHRTLWRYTNVVLLLLLLYSKIHFIFPLVFYRHFNGDICEMMQLI